MNKYFDIVVIKGNWQGGHHGTHPKILSVSPEADKPFGVSEGWGHGLGGNYFSLKELVEKEFIEIFNEKESEALYGKIIKAYKQGVNQNTLAKQLLDEFNNNA